MLRCVMLINGTSKKVHFCPVEVCQKYYIPHAVFDVAVSRESYHFILLSNIMQEGMFIVGKKSVRNPNLISEITRKSNLYISVGREGKSIVFPVLP